MRTLVEVKTAELIGPVLDWAVAKADGHEPIVTPFKYSIGNALYLAEWAQREGIRWQPSTDWSQGGPLIEKHRVSTEAPGVSSGFWTASMPGSALMGVCQGPTPLVAGCRRLVREHLGDVVQVPAELLERAV